MMDESRVSVAGSSDNSIPSSDNSNDLLDTQTQVSKKRKEIQPRSMVWDHYDKLMNENDTYIGKVKCRYCFSSLVYTSSNGTTGLKQHLQRCQVYKPLIESPSQQKINFQSNDTSSLWKFEQEVVRRALVEMIIVDELPFSFVEKEGFKKFMNQAQPLFRIPSRRTITRDCYDLYGELKCSLKKSFREIKPKICLTTDTWTSMQRINYMCLTAHFIDRNWVLHKRILNFCPISSHKGDQMADAISNCLLDWHLDNVFCVTVDNAASNSVTVTHLSKQLDMWGTNIMSGKHLHMRCMAHILNLIVHEGLKEIGKSVKRVRQMVRYVRSSPARTRNFMKCCEVQKIECHKSLLLDVPTRWNSTYEMLEMAQYFEKAFDRFDLFDPNFKTFLSTHICEEDGSVAGLLECDDWANVRSVVKFLEKFYDLTIKVSGSHYVTSNVHFEDICELDVYLKACLASDDLDLSTMAGRMMQKFKTYWGSPEKMNPMIYIASVLDPCNKFEYVSFALEDLFGKEVGQKVDKGADAYLKDLFKEYLRKYSREYQSSPSRSTSSHDTSDSSSSGSQSGRTKTLRTKLHLKKQKEDCGSGSAKSELERYIAEDQEPDHDDFDLLNWWKVNAPRFPVLSELARDVLAIPISSVASECAFSTGGRILDRFRSSLTPKCVQSLICAQDWLRKETKSICVEESLEYLEQLEVEMTNNGRDPCIVDV